jgi:periplasmic protein CpxP/Spy
MFRRFSILALVVLSLGGTTAIVLPKVFQTSAIAQMQDGQRPERGNRGDRGDRGDWLKDLNLSPDQMRQMQEIRGRYREQISQQRQSMRQAQQELRSLMASNAPADQVRQKYNQVRGLKQKLADTQFDSMLAMREILTLEQRQKLAEKMASRRGKFRDRMSERMNESN